MTPRQKRFQELEALIERQEQLTDDEYLALLHECRKNYTSTLVQLSLTSTRSGTGAALNVIDKVHWLIDNMETKTIERPVGDDINVRVFFQPAEDDEAER